MKGETLKEHRRSRVRRPEAELSTLPEVAALATELTRIFKSLGMTQHDFAIRANYDTSYISRVLNGRRVAKEEFIDRLLCEIEDRLRTPVTDETRARLKQLRSNALRVYDSDLYEIESIRSELGESRREVQRLILHQEALVGLLERRKAETGECRRELERAQSDWISHRVRSEAELLSLKGENLRRQDERQRLLREISELRAELENTIGQKEAAEQRCALLREQVEAAENELAEKREKVGIDDVGLPVDIIQVRLQQAGDGEIYRELAEFAIGRPSVDVAQLAMWLYSEGLHPHDDRLVADYCQQRSTRSAVRLILDIERLRPNGYEDRYSGLVEQVVQVIFSRDREDLIEFCTLYVKAHRDSGCDEKIASLGFIVYDWFSRTGRFPLGRSQHFSGVVDFLTELGEREAVIDLIRQGVNAFGIIPKFGQMVAASGSVADVEILVTELLEVEKGREKKFPVRVIPGELVKASKHPNSLLTVLLLAGACETYEPSNLSEILSLGEVEVEDVVSYFAAKDGGSGVGCDTL